MSVDVPLVSYYAARATEYERIYQKPERQDDLRWLRDFVGGEFSGANVIEVACGTGFWTEIIARSAASVVATDINEEVLAIARSKPIASQTVSFLLADAYALPAFKGGFDAGFSGFWWSHIPKADIGGFLLGFHRVLGRGAKVLFIDNAYVEGSSTPISRRDEFGNTYQTRRLEDGSKHEVLKNFPTEAELRGALDGLAADVQVRFLKYYWVFSYTI